MTPGNLLEPRWHGAASIMVMTMMIGVMMVIAGGGDADGASNHDGRGGSAAMDVTVIIRGRTGTAAQVLMSSEPPFTDLLCSRHTSKAPHSTLEI